MLVLLLGKQPTDIWQDPTVNFFTTNGIALLSIIVSIIVAIWSISKQHQKKEISCEVISDAPVISINKAVAPRIEIRLDGNIIQAMTLLVIKVENTGNTAVESKDYIEPLTFKFTNRKVINSEITETNPRDLIDVSNYKTFISISTSELDRIEFPNFPLNANEFVIFSVLTDGAKDKISKKGRIVNGAIIQIMPKEADSDSPYLLVGGMILLLLLMGTVKITADISPPLADSISLVIFIMLGIVALLLLIAISIAVSVALLKRVIASLRNKGLTSK